MATFDFSPISNYIVLKFTCPFCGNDNETDALYVPTPDFSAETHNDSVNYEDYEHQCDECDHLFEITLNNGFYGGDGEISDIEDGVSVEEDFLDEDYKYEEEYKSMFFDEYVIETIDVLDKIDVLDESSKKLLYRTLYANIISSMEAYLSDRLIQKVLSSEETKRQFVENFKDFEGVKFTISSIYEKMEELESLIKKSLRDIVYHNLPRVKNIYKSTLNIDLGNISNLMKCITIRHDIVHRNGKDNDGNLQIISKNDVETLALEVTEFIRHIENQFNINDIDNKRQENEQSEVIDKQLENNDIDNMLKQFLKIDL